MLRYFNKDHRISDIIYINIIINIFKDNIFSNVVDQNNINGH